MLKKSNSINRRQIVHGRQYHGLEDFRKAVAEFIKQANESHLWRTNNEDENL